MRLKSAAHPGEIFFNPLEHFFRGVGSLPFAGSHFVGLGQSRIRMNGAEYLVEADPLFHGQDVFSQQVARVMADDKGDVKGIEMVPRRR